MRQAEARITLGVMAAQVGDLETVHAWCRSGREGDCRPLSLVSRSFNDDIGKADTADQQTGHTRHA
jgi:hypothetical protein